MKKSVFKIITAGLMAFLLAFTQLSPGMVKVNGMERAPMRNLVVHYEGCTHVEDSFGYIGIEKADCHDQVIWSDSFTYTDSKTFQRRELPSSGNGWKYDAASNTLTLTNFKGAGIFAETGDLDKTKRKTFTIELIGDNTLYSTKKELRPIYLKNVNLVIKGGGTLKIDQADKDLSGHGVDDAIDLDRGNLQISGGSKVEVITSQDNPGIKAMFVDERSGGGDVTVDKGCSLSVKTLASPIAIKCENLYAYGTVIGETSYNKDKDVIMAISAFKFFLGSGLTLKSGDDYKKAKVVPIESNFINNDDYRAYMEVSDRKVATTALKTYKITYVMNGGINNKSNPATYDGSKAILLAGPSRKGYFFGGWFTDRKLTKKIYAIDEGSKINYTLYAKWIKK